MSRAVGIAELKTHLSAYLRRVRKGEILTVMDRDHPVAQITPVERSNAPLRVHRARGRLADVDLPPPLRTRSDIVALLLEERGER